VSVVRIGVRGKQYPRNRILPQVEPRGSIFLVDDPALAGTGARKEIIEWALSRRLPLASPNSSVAPDGGLVSFGTDRPALARRAAFYVDKILKGAKPADRPVERPSTFKLSVNVKTAKAMG
jgi:ABC-type uncharacterized transport system substrate-binding protein